MGPNRRPPSTACLQAFCRVVQTRSFSKAGSLLGISGSAVSKLVSQLEIEVGSKLLTRTTRSVALTEAGTAFYRSTVDLLDELELAVERARQETTLVRGTLRVSLPSSFALRWLASRLPTFQYHHPALELDIELDDHKINLTEQGFDCAIRIATGLPDSSLIAKPLGYVRRVVVASPAYLRQAPPLHRPADLALHRCLLYSLADAPNEWPLQDAERGSTSVLVSGHYRVNNSLMLREAIAQGLGVALTPLFVVDDLLADGRAVELLTAHLPAAHTVYGVVAHHRHIPKKVAVFFDFVAATLV
ncbi:MAG: LysR family transcriptional regulator [Halothiobacillaceae bacterium]|nr:MAG: LysR family transcriptional regulator [Halothiobacillaceae bacterium]